MMPQEDWMANPKVQRLMSIKADAEARVSAIRERTQSDVLKVWSGTSYSPPLTSFAENPL
jgi:hypothetical protein